MSSPVTAASYVGTPPGDTILMPDDGDPRTAAWIRDLAALVLANDAFYAGLVEELYYRNPLPDADTAPSYTNATTAFTQIGLVIFTSPGTEDVAVGDIVNITFTCTAQSTGAGLIVLTVQQDSDPSGVEITAARVRIPSSGTDVPVSLSASFVVTEAGGLLVRAEGALSVLGGSLSVVEAYRLEAHRVRPTG